MINPYLDELKKEGISVDPENNNSVLFGKHFEAGSILKSFKVRRDLVDKYSWAIPNEEAILAIKDLGKKIIEIGAGRGYWGWLLHQVGVDIVCYDKGLPNNWHSRYGDLTYYPVLEGGPEELLENKDRTLFLCWPPYDDDLVTQCLDRYDGEIIIYVGENDGCTGHDERLERKEVYKRVSIPQYYFIHDYMVIYKRSK
jgi:hypothetical protein